MTDGSENESFVLSGELVRPDNGLGNLYGQLKSKRPEVASTHDRLVEIANNPNFDEDHLEQLIRVWNNAEIAKGKINPDSQKSEIAEIVTFNGELKILRILTRWNTDYYSSKAELKL